MRIWILNSIIVYVIPENHDYRRVHVYRQQTGREGGLSEPLWNVSVTSKRSIDQIHELAEGQLLGFSCRKIVLLNESGVTAIDEEDLLSDAIAFYKCEMFDPTKPIRVIMRTQPAIDIGGIRRQYFSDVLHHLACKDYVCWSTRARLQFTQVRSSVTLSVKIQGLNRGERESLSSGSVSSSM